MYVCVCKGVTENQIREAIRGGLRTRKQISRCLGAGTGCGKCHPDVGALLQDSVATEPGHRPSQVVTAVPVHRSTAPAPRGASLADAATSSPVTHGHGPVGHARRNTEFSHRTAA